MKEKLKKITLEEALAICRWPQDIERALEEDRAAGRKPRPIKKVIYDPAVTGSYDIDDEHVVYKLEHGYVRWYEKEKYVSYRDAQVFYFYPNYNLEGGSGKFTLWKDLLGDKRWDVNYDEAQKLEEFRKEYELLYPDYHLIGLGVRCGKGECKTETSIEWDDLFGCTLGLQKTGLTTDIGRDYIKVNAPYLEIIEECYLGRYTGDVSDPDFWKLNVIMKRLRGEPVSDDSQEVADSQANEAYYKDLKRLEELEERYYKEAKERMPLWNSYKEANHRFECRELARSYRGYNEDNYRYCMSYSDLSDMRDAAYQGLGVVNGLKDEVTKLKQRVANYQMKSGKVTGSIDDLCRAEREKQRAKRQRDTIESQKARIAMLEKQLALARQK